MNFLTWFSKRTWPNISCVIFRSDIFSQHTQNQLEKLIFSPRASHCELFLDYYKFNARLCWLKCSLLEAMKVASWKMTAKKRLCEGRKMCNESHWELNGRNGIHQYGWGNDSLISFVYIRLGVSYCTKPKMQIVGNL